MSSTKNAQSVSNWNQNISEDHQEEEQPNPVDSQTIPRTPGGVVNESGDVVTDDGKSIGHVADSEDGRSMAGNPVTASGDVVDSAGGVVSKASLNEEHQEYTTSKEQKSENPGYFNSAKGEVSKTMGGVRSGLGSGSRKGSEAPSTEQAEGTSKESTSKGPGSATTETTTQDAHSEAPEEAHKDASATAQDATSGGQDRTTSETPVQSEGRDHSADNKDEQKVSDVDDEQKAAGEKNSPEAEMEGEQVNMEGNQTAAAEDSQIIDERDDRETADTKDDEAASDHEQDSTAADVKDEQVAGQSDSQSVDPKESQAADEKDQTADLADTEAVREEGDQNVTDTNDEQTAADDTDELKDSVDANVEDDKNTGEKDNQKSDVDAVQANEGSDDQNNDEKEIQASDVEDVQASEPAGEEKTTATNDDETSGVKDDQISDEKDTQAPAVEDVQASEEKDDEKDLQESVNEQDKPEQGSDGLSDSNHDDTQQPDISKSPAPSEGEQPQVPEGEAQDEDGEPDKAEEGETEATEVEKVDFSILKGAKVNKAGNLVDDDGEVVGHIVEGDAKKLQGKRADKDGNIWDDSGNIVGKAEPIPDNERDSKKDFAPFENFPDAVVEADGRVLSEGRQVGTVVEGDSKRLKGSKVDEDGDILDRNGNVVGKAEAWDEPEPVPEEEPEVVDRSILAGKRVNKAGNVVDSAGIIFGKVVEGNVSAIVGRMCDKEGNVRSESGDVVGKAEVVPEGEREGSKEGPFAELSGLTVRKDGMVVTPSNEVVGRLVSGDAKTLLGRSVDEDGDVTDKNGNVLGKAERYEEPEEEKKKGPMAGRKVNREGNVLDEDGNVIGKLISGDALTCAGKEVDDDGDVINSKGNSVGHVALLEDIPEPGETDEQKSEREQAAKDKKLAGQLSSCIEQSLDRVRPICKLIDDKIDKAERTPKEELDEEDLVKQVKPLIEEGGKILDETNGVIRGLDPDGRIQRNAKHKSNTKEASPEEHHLAEVLKELTGTVSKTVDSARRKIQDMPHAKKELNPLWGLLMEPLGQILAAVGLLLSGVLGLVGRLLSGLGLGGLVDGLLGTLGLGKILGSLGLGSAYDSLVGKNQKKK